MRISTLPETVLAPLPPSGSTSVVTGITINDQVTIPAWVVDHASYRRWAHSDEFPEAGKYAYLNGEIWVDLSMEEILAHNKVKSAFAFAIMKVLAQLDLGEYMSDGVLLTHPQVNLSVEPDSLVYLWSTLESKKLTMIPGKVRGYMEFSGSPDMTLEIVSDSSVRKDTVNLRKLYWQAGIAEYWLVDARGETAAFEILRHDPSGYVNSPTDDNWQKSSVLKHDFRLIRQINRLGFASFVVESRPIT